MSYSITSPALYLEQLITDTWEDKIFWDSFTFEYGMRDICLINIKGTKKYLKLELFEMGSSSFLKTEFHKYPKTEDNVVRFENIKLKEQRERMNRLILAVTRQRDI